jgi:hypothetical protein
MQRRGKHTSITIEELLGNGDSVVINRRLYDEDTRPAETELKKSPGTGVEDD